MRNVNLRKRVVGLALSLTLALSLFPTAAAAQAGLDHFKRVNTYTDQTFQDVPAGSWYRDNVKSAYELDLMKGTRPDKFSPSGNVTVGEAVTMACRLHSIYHTGKADFVQGNPWYQVYVDYALDNKIITAGQFTNYDAAATRRQFAAIFAKALPQSALTAKNTVADGAIPDLAKGSANYDDVYLLYRAGILTGNDAKGTFQPEKSIGRDAVSAMVSRMADPALRQKITLEAPPVAATGVSLNKTSLTLNVDDSQRLTATVTPTDATDKTVTWTTSNSSVATVSSSGLVTAKREGSARITATTANGKTATCYVTVTENALVEVSYVTVSPGSLTLEAGERQTLSATVRPTNATDKSVRWSSSDTSVVTVSSSGTVTAVREGSARVTATASNGESDDCRITVKASTTAPTFSVPKLNQNYGPMTVTANYSSGGVQYQSQVTNFTFTKATLRSDGAVTLTAKIQGTNTTGNYCYVKVNLYNSSGTLLDSDYAATSVTTGEPFALEKSFTFDADALQKAAKIEFYSYSNAKATAGITQPDPDPSDYDDYYGFSGIPEFDQFTRSGRSTLNSNSSNTAGYLYASVTQAEVNRYMNALEACGFTKNSIVGSMFFFTKGTSGDPDYREVRLSTSASPSSTGLAATVGLSKIKPANEWSNSGSGSDPSGNGEYSGFSGIPKFDQFTSSGRSTLSSNSSNTAGYLYASVTQAEVDRYVAALEDAGFTKNEIAGGMFFFTKGTSGQDDFREVRLSTTASPSSTGLAATVGLSKIKPSNEW